MAMSMQGTWEAGLHTAVCSSCACSAWTNKLITAKDHASIQINIGHLNEDGTYNGQFTTFALTGKVRAIVSMVKSCFMLVHLI